MKKGSEAKKESQITSLIQKCDEIINALTEMENLKPEKETYDALIMAGSVKRSLELIND